jgi:hypothetical protein
MSEQAPYYSPDDDCHEACMVGPGLGDDAGSSICLWHGELDPGKVIETTVRFANIGFAQGRISRNAELTCQKTWHHDYKGETCVLCDLDALRSKCERLEKAAHLSEEALERFGALSDPSGKGREVWKKYGGPAVEFIQSVLTHPDVSQEKGEEPR